MDSNAVALTTERLRLRPLQRSETAIIHDHWTTPGVRRYLWDGEAIPLARAEEVVSRSEDLFEEAGAGLWSIRLREHTELIGCAGFWPFHDPPQTELLISLSEAHWGNGYAREAAEALLRLAFVSLRWDFVQASADAPNDASLNLIRRLGMRPHASTPGAFGEIEIFRLTRQRWLEQGAAAEAAPPLV